MNVFEHVSFDGHEQVVFCHDRETGLRGIIAVHNTTLGPALGGCRMRAYASDGEALNDVLRLSRAMSYKAAMANLQLGGGKSVIIGDPKRDKTLELMQAMGRCVEQLGGRYIAAEDSGTGVADLRAMGQATAHVSGVMQRRGFAGNDDGDPSPATAYGVFVGLRACVARVFGSSDLTGVCVAIQGLGNVGFGLARLLHDAGALLWVSDIDANRVRRAMWDFGAVAVAPDALFDQDVDVIAPCALGAGLNDDTCTRIKARVVAGGANNQLADEARHGDTLRRRGVLYAPDYVLNAGGVIDLAHQGPGYDPARVRRHVEGIGDTLDELFDEAERARRPPHEVANRLARQRLGTAPQLEETSHGPA